MAADPNQWYRTLCPTCGPLYFTMTTSGRLPWRIECEACRKLCRFEACDTPSREQWLESRHVAAGRADKAGILVAGYLLD